MTSAPAESPTYPTDLRSLAAALVRIETENPPGNERECAEYVRDWFAQYDIDAELVTDPDPERPQVGARVAPSEGETDAVEGDTDGPTLVLNGHLDVVPVGDHDEWTHPPYAGVVADGRLYGRGSVDMKTGVAIAMLTAYELRAELESGALDGSIVVHAAMGEETAEPGTRALLEAGYDGDYGVVLEPTECRVATSEKGMAWYELSWPGVPAHASRPDEGTNPTAHYPVVLDALAEYDARLRDRTDPLCGCAYATVTGTNAGVGSNKAVIPERASVTVDRRILPAETIDDVDDEFAALVDTLEREHGIAASWRRDETYTSAVIPTDHHLATVFREHAAAVAGVDPEPWGIKASTDVREFVNVADVPAITWGPGSLDQAHSIDEYVDLDAAEAGFEILKRAARTLLEPYPDD
ncbi:M20 family metallopeptidase [Halorubellus litoreus]|uniref:M20 family metallopeptidase n=1 Tax=Halorubellus litoreus TaxID=755308 RepID=A0ABD5V859_9EURY